MNSEQAATNSVFKIFKEMSLGPEPVDVEFAKDWINKSKQVVTEPPVGDSEQLLDENTENVGKGLPDFRRLAQVVEQRREDLVGMLVLLKYTWCDANKIISMMINEYKCHDIKAQLKHGPDSLDLGDRYIYDAPLMGRYIAKILYTGPDSSLSLCDYDLEPFYSLLWQIFYQNKLSSTPSLRLYKGNVSSLKLRDAFRMRPCPMIIWEDADISSAVDCFCQSICEFQAKVSWSVSHVFVQESVFKRTVSLLEFKMGRIPHGSRFDKRTRLEYVDDPSSSEPGHDLKVFKACDKSPIKLCIGWSPKDIDEAEKYSKANGYIPILPYRNLDDLRSLLKDICCDSWLDFPVSIWTERVASPQVSAFSQFSTLWLNSHGLFHPLIPCELDQISRYFWKLPDWISPNPRHPGCKNHLIRPDVGVALRESVKAFQDWNSMKIQDKFSTLVSFYKHLTHKPTDVDEFSTISHGDGLFKPYADSFVGGLASKAKVMCDRGPMGTVVILTEQPNVKALKVFVASLLFHGNSVVVCQGIGCQNIVTDALKELHDLASPQHLLTFAVLPSLEECMLELYPYLNVIYFDFLNYKRILRVHDEYLMLNTSLSKSIWFL